MQGMIIWTDGGCRPNPGFGGWGMHGYLFNPEPPKKGSGNSSQLLTDKGYVSKIENAPIAKKPKEESEDFFAVKGDDDIIIGDAAPAKPVKEVKPPPVKRVLPAWVKEITPIHYVDGYGSFLGVVSNNIGEMFAVLRALMHALEYDVKALQIFTDSEYVRQGLESWIHGWQRNNWLKSDGTPPKNVDYWKQLIEMRDRLEGRGTKVKINWVRGHNDNYGNERADRLATVGVMCSRDGVQRNEITTSPADGYWKYDTERHPFLFNRRMYFNSLSTQCVPGEYYMGDHGKEDDLLGKRISDGTYACIRLREPDPVLEMVRNYQIEVARGTDSIILCRTDAVFHPQTHRELTTYGRHAIWQATPSRMDLCCMPRYISEEEDVEDSVNQEPLTVELRPARLAMRAVESVAMLSDKLDAFLRGDANIVKTDLTHILYETTIKEVKNKPPVALQTLKPEYNVGYAALKIDANYQVDGGISSAPVTLNLGIDLMDRNALKRLESLNPVINVISWLESPGVFRYATVVEADGSVGIWAGVYSNLRFVS